jgi:hypothetical protein
MKMRHPSFEELEKLVKEGRCVNCGRKVRIMIPLYQNPCPTITADMKKRFTEEQFEWLMKNGGICLNCSEF